MKELNVTMLQKLKRMAVIPKICYYVFVITQVKENLMNNYVLEINVLAIRDQKEKCMNYTHILYPSYPRVPEDFVLL